MGNQNSLNDFHNQFPSLKEFIPDQKTLLSLQAWIVQVAPHFTGHDFRAKNNERIRIEMRRIVKDQSDIKLRDNCMIDLIVDFLLIPHLKRLDNETVEELADKKGVLYKSNQRRSVKDSLYAFGVVGEQQGWETAFADMFETKRDLKTIVKRLKALDK